jgi:hypothetical protein
MYAVPYLDALIKEWKAATWEETRALDARISRGMSASNRDSWRGRARGELRQIESKLNSHISGCATCETDGHKSTFNLAEGHE